MAAATAKQPDVICTRLEPGKPALYTCLTCGFTYDGQSPDFIPIDLTRGKYALSIMPLLCPHCELIAAGIRT